jgi:hypothetical protein
MPKTDNLSLRVNGIVYERVGLQYELVDGMPTGPNQVVIKDDPIAPFPLTNEFFIELKAGEGEWERVTLMFLKTLLQAYRED